jgi:hypothetical protein
MQPAVLQQRSERPSLGPFDQPSYASRVLKQYVGLLAKSAHPEILDIGPVCGSNITFFLEHASKLHIHDVITRSPEGRQPAEWNEALPEAFSYEENSMEAIHAWDLFDHIGNHDLSKVVQKLVSFLKPHGLLIMVASNTTGQQPFFQFLKIGPELTVTLQKSMVRRLPYFYRTNRDIEKAMQPLTQIASSICTNGVREFLYRRPR